MRTQASQEISEMEATQIEQSMFMTTSAYQQASDQPLSVSLELSLQKCSLWLVLNEASPSYDHVYEVNLTPEDLMKNEARFNYSHFGFQISDLSAFLDLTNVKRKVTKNPFADQQPSKASAPFDKVVNVRVILASISGTRYDLHDGPNPQLADALRSTEVMSGGQYDSFQSSSVFRSAHEFYNLQDSKVGQSTVYSASKRTHQQPGSSQPAPGKQAQASVDASFISPEIQQLLQYPPPLNPPLMNPFTQHFCQSSLLFYQPTQDPLFKESGAHCIFELRLQLIIDQSSKRESKVTAKLKTKIGGLSIRVGLPELLVLLQLTKGISFPKNDTSQNGVQSNKTKQVVEIVQVEIEGIGLAIVGSQIQSTQLVAAIIENKPFEHVTTILTSRCEPDKELIIASFIDFKLLKDKQQLIKLELARALLTLPDTNQTLLSLECLSSEITVIIAKQQDDLQSKPLPTQAPFVYYEGQEQLASAASAQNQSLLSTSRYPGGKQTRDTLSISLKVEHADLLIDMDTISQYIITVQQVEAFAKLMLVALDIIRVYSRECRDKRYIERLKRDELFQAGIMECDIDFEVTQEQATGKNTNLELSVSVSNLQVLVFESANGVKELFKIRVLEPSVTMKYIPPSKGSVSVRKERVQVQVNIADIIAIDYCQKKPSTMQLFDRNPESQKVSLSQTQEQLHFFTSDGKIIRRRFEEDLLGSEHQMIVYRQQSFRDKAPLLNLKVELQFRIEQLPFEERVSLDTIGSLFVGIVTTANPNDHISLIFDEFGQLKKNPMICRLGVRVHGVILNLLPLQNTILIEKIHEISKKLRIQFPSSSVPQAQKPQESKDCFECTLTLQSITIDYSPTLLKKHYDMVYLSDFESVQLTQSLAPEVLSLPPSTDLYKTTLRSLISFGELSLSFRQFTANDASTKELTLKATDLSFRLLQNPFTTDYDHSPCLLLDTLQSIDSPGALLDQMGFAQILYADLLEMRKTEQNEEKAGFPEEAKQEEEDLFSTSYGSHPASTQEDSTKDNTRSLSLVVVTNKIAFYLAKDTFQAVKQLAQILTLQIQHLDQTLNPSQEEAEPSLEADVIGEEFLEAAEENNFQKLIEEFLITDYDPGVERDGQPIPVVAPMNVSEEAKHRDPVYHVDQEQEGYFTINSALYVQKRADIQKLPLIQKLVNLKEIVVDDYLPSLNANDVAANRHRHCHQLPDSLLKSPLLLKLHFEIHSFELKLFEGADFDFLTSRPQGGFGTVLIVNHSKEVLQRRDAAFQRAPQQNLMQSWSGKSSVAGENSNLRESLISCKDDYLIGAEESKQSKKQVPCQLSLPPMQYLRRPRKQGRGHYLQLTIGNCIFSLQQFEREHVFTRCCLSVQSLILKETISSSSVHELLQTAPYQKHYDNQLEVIVQKEVLTKDLKEDYALNLRIQPTKILLNQAILKFCLNFFEGIIPTPTEGASKKKPRRSSIGGPKKEILVSQIVIHPSYLILSYTSRNLNLMDLTSGNLLEFLNIIDISGLRLSIQSYHLKQSLPIEAAIKHLLRFYIDDLVGNQKVNIVKAIGPMRAVVNLTGAVYGLVRKPYKSYMNDRGVFKGFGEGAYDFYRVITEESGNLSQKLIGGVTMVAKGQKK